MNLGKIVETGEDCEIDLNKLISTRMLINANSGAGKSWLGRRMMEQCANKAQQIIIDLEGEFVSLRERYDFLLVGKGGEIPLSLKSAELLALKLLELKVSAIIDLSEFKKHERHLFIKKFVDSLMDSPQNLWHPLLVYVDEAHQFAPEGKSGKAESKSSMIDLGTRGRKRGFCGVFMTQRISKLDKDLAAELNNQMTGRTTLDIDRKRASDNLGFTTKEQERGLRDLPDGVFHVFGPAFKHKGIAQMKVGGINTTHPDRTKGILVKPTRTPDSIKEILKDVIDLPKEAEVELRTKKDLQDKVTELKREVRTLKHSKPKPEADQRALEKSREIGFNECKKGVMEEINFLRKENDLLIKRDEKIGDLLKIPLPPRPEYSLPRLSSPLIKPAPQIKPVGKTLPRMSDETYTPDKGPIGVCARKIYSFLYNHPERAFTKHHIGAFTGYSHKSGGFSNALSQLNSNDLITKSGNTLQVSKMDPEVAEEFDFSKEAIMSNLGVCPKKIYQLLLDNPYQEYSKEEIGEITGYSHGSGGFSNAVSKLNSLGLIQKDNSHIKLNQELLEV